MQGLNPLLIVSQWFDSLTLTLQPPDTKSLQPTDDRRQAYIEWAIANYVYSVIAHIRTILRGIKVLADEGNIPTSIIVCRHIFEWTAHVCYMNENLQKHVAARDWDAARDLLSQAFIGNRWLKERGHKYEPTFDKETIPNTIRLSKVLSCYEAHVQKVFGDDAKDDYAHLSEHSHPNSACLQHYHDDDVPGGEIRFKEPATGSPLPVVNWCLIDLNTLLLELLILSGETAIRPHIVGVLTKMAELAEGKQRA